MKRRMIVNAIIQGLIAINMIKHSLLYNIHLIMKNTVTRFLCMKWIWLVNTRPCLVEQEQIKSLLYYKPCGEIWQNPTSSINIIKPITIFFSFSHILGLQFESVIECIVFSERPLDLVWFSMGLTCSTVTAHFKLISSLVFKF